MNKVKIAVFVSGGGTNLEAILKASEAGKIPHGEFALVLSSSPTAYALERAKNHGIESVTVSRKEFGDKFEEKARHRNDSACGIYVHPLGGIYEQV